MFTSNNVNNNNNNNNNNSNNNNILEFLFIGMGTDRSVTSK